MLLIRHISLKIIFLDENSQTEDFSSASNYHHYCLGHHSVATQENRIKLFDSVQREIFRKSDYVLFKFLANLFILKNLRRIGPTKYCNICTRGLELPKNYTFNSKKRRKLQMSIISVIFWPFLFISRLL